jgi:hypothetical protein
VLLAVRLRSSEWLGLGRPCIRAAGSVGERAGVVVTVRVLPGGGVAGLRVVVWWPVFGPCGAGGENKLANLAQPREPFSDLQ